MSHLVKHPSLESLFLPPKKAPDHIGHHEGEAGEFAHPSRVTRTRNKTNVRGFSNEEVMKTLLCEMLRTVTGSPGQEPNV